MQLSVEDQLSSIEEQYLKAFNFLRSIDKDILWQTTAKTTQAIKGILELQRSIELLFEDVKKMYDEKTESYFKRCAKNMGHIKLRIRGSSSYDGVCRSLDFENYEEAFKKFKYVRSYMYEILEDVRLIYALRMYPIEEKMALKSTLTDYGFMEVTKCVEEAEQHFAEKHFKDCITRCRESLEKTASSVLAAEKRKPSGYFATDMGTLSGLGIGDKEVKKLTEATYSYLSEVGAHGRGGKVTLGDTHFAMKETYMRIDILLKKYKAYLASKKRS
jgi:hypothetical protein